VAGIPAPPPEPGALPLPAEPTRLPRPHFRADIEGLRAVAILLVVGYHIDLPGFRGGFVGVDVFFVISGYLITWLLVAEAEETGRVGLLRFYARRARRLLPALTLMLAVTIAASAVVFAPFEQPRLSRSAAATAAYVSNVAFARWSTDYSGGGGKDPFLHTWSLSVEEQFYLGWPAFILLALGLWGRSRQPRRGRLLVGLAVVAAASLAACVWFTYERELLAFYLSPMRAWEFAVGALGILVPLRRGAPRVAGWAGLAVIAATSVLFYEAMSFPGAAALVPVLGTVLVLRAGAAGRGGAGRVLAVRPLQFIGRLSYGWYLWHWPVLVLAGAVYGGLWWYERLGLMGLALGLAVVSFYAVERPIRHARGLGGRPVLVLAGAVLTAVLSVGATLLWGHAADRWAEGPRQARYTQARMEAPVAYGAMDCDVGYYGAAVKVCAFGPADAPFTGVLLGDSHAGQWVSAAVPAFRARGWRLLFITKSACPVADVPMAHPLAARPFTECAAWRDAALRRIERLRPDLVVVSSSDDYGFTPEAWTAGTAATLGRLSDAARHVVLLRDTPSPGFDLLRCEAQQAWRPDVLGGAGCPVRVDTTDGAAVFAAQRRAAAAFPNVRVLDLSPAILPALEDEEGPFAGIAFRDAGHLSVGFSRSLAGPFGAALDRATATAER